MTRPKTVVFGVDGGSWNLIRPWVASGELPTLARLTAEGAHGNLESTVPFVTFPAWKCYSTGKNPGKFGVYWWMHTDVDRRTMEVNNARSFRSEEYWDLLGREGVRVGVVNMPSTYPVKRVNGFMVAGAPAEESNEFTYPRELKRELLEEYGYEINPPGGIDKDPEAKVDHAIRQMETQCQVALDRWDDVDLLHVTLFAIDNLQHMLWHRPELLKRAWRAIDAQLARFVRDDALVIVMSDHGFTEQRASFFVNTWLQRNGYLTLKETLGDRLYDLGVHTGSVAGLVERLGLKRFVPQGVKEAAAKRLLNPQGLATWQSKSDKIDWERTVAIADGEGPLHVVDGPHKAALVEEIRDALLSDEEARRFVADVKRKEELYSGPHLDRAPDLVLIPQLGVEIVGSLGAGDLFRTETVWKGTHRREGILVAHGPGVTPGEVEGARIYDVAPTILRRYGVAPPADYDGRPLPFVDGRRAQGGEGQLEAPGEGAA